MLTVLAWTCLCAYMWKGDVGVQTSEQLSSQALHVLWSIKAVIKWVTDNNSHFRIRICYSIRSQHVQLCPYNILDFYIRGTRTKWWKNIISAVPLQSVISKILGTQTFYWSLRVEWTFEWHRDAHLGFLVASCILVHGYLAPSSPAPSLAFASPLILWFSLLGFPYTTLPSHASPSPPSAPQSQRPPPPSSWRQRRWPSAPAPIPEDDPDGEEIGGDREPGLQRDVGILVVRLGNEVGTPAALLAPHVEGADLGDGESVHGLEAAADVHLGGGGDSPDGELLHGRQRGWGSGRFAKWITRRPNRLAIAVGGGWGWSGRGGRGLRRAAADRWEGEEGFQVGSPPAGRWTKWLWIVEARSQEETRKPN